MLRTKQKGESSAITAHLFDVLLALNTEVPALSLSIVPGQHPVKSAMTEKGQNPAGRPRLTHLSPLLAGPPHVQAGVWDAQQGIVLILRLADCNVNTVEDDRV